MMTLLIGGGLVPRAAAAQDCPSCQQFAVYVAPAPGSDAHPLSSGPWTVQFMLTNTGNLDDNYSFTCSSTGGISCGTVTPTNAWLASGDSIQVSVTYSVGTSVGEVRLTATGEASATGWYVVSANPTITIVAPVLTSGSRAVVRGRQPVVRALFTANGSSLDTTKTILKWRTDTVTTLARANRGLIEWEPDSARWLGGHGSTLTTDSALITVTACGQNSLCTTVTRWAVLLNDNKPVLGFTGMPLEALGRQFAAPFGPGLSVSGAEVQTGFGTPSFVSLGIERGAGLVYSTRQSYPRALVHVDLELTWPVGTPDQIKLILWDGAVKRDSLQLSSPTCATGTTRRCRATLQADYATTTFSTPTRKWLAVEARVTSGAVTQVGTDSVEVVLVDRRTTMYGSGWWPSGIVKLVQAGSDRLLVGPTGAVNVYRGNGDSLFLAPPGDFTALVKLAGVGGAWELRPRGSTAKLVFDTYGRLIKAFDQNGNKDSIVYSGTTDQVTSLRDPLSKTITFGYVSGKLATITDPGNRQTKLSINGTTNQLTYDSLPSPTSKPYTTTFVYTTYPGTSTVVLTKRIGVITDTTVVTYDSTFKRRPSQVTLPKVQDETGASVTPVIAYTAVERQGYGALRSLDSVYVELKDPRLNWTRSLVHRWGQARKTWDALGTLGRAQYTPEGFVQWSEGKNGDSSRVYHAYDSQRRLVKTLIVRPASDTLRLDSLVYDTSHRVTKRIDARGKEARWHYDPNGNVIASVQQASPTGDSTSYWYRTDGLVDSVRAPGDSTSVRFTYETTWKNLSQVKDQNGTVLVEHYYDSFGRELEAAGKIAVRATQDSSYLQWRRVETFYTVANQVDSVRVMRTDNCAPLCNDPNWPAESDTVRTQRVGYRFDRAGRDSLRLNDRGKATLYLYDRLGRLTSRRPWTDSMSVKDSLVYDVAGNVKKTITRRGDTLVVQYDSRNRDTATVVPGVGTIKPTFSGPLDQLTRLRIDSLVDSIGGVNPEVRWGFDARGRLKADTSYTGATVRATSYTYDTYERTSTMTDPLGTWGVGYEPLAKRGAPNTLVTPFSDTLTYVWDKRSRPVGPTIRSSGPIEARTPVWNKVGGLSTLTHSVSTTPSWVPGKWDRRFNPDSSGPPLVPVWTQQYGSGSSVDSLRDSVTYDGWERVAAWVQQKKSGGGAWSVAARDTFKFDRTGNVKTTAGAEVYDVVTGRLTSHSTAGGTRYYTYDRAGNLVKDSLANGTETWVYGYTALDQLRSVRRNGTLIARYGYDVLGRRIAKRVYSSASGGTVAYTRFVYHGGHVGFEVDSGTTIGLRYTWGLGTDDLVGVRDGSGNQFYAVTDLLGSVRGLVKRDGTWIRTLRYGPYGALLADTAAASGGPSGELRYRWTGREYDSETGWYFHRARYYSPAIRRFVQEDPIGYAGGANLYTYVGGRVLGSRDPFGLLMTDPSVEMCVSARALYLVTVYTSGRRTVELIGYEIVGAPYACGGGGGGGATGGGGGGGAPGPGPVGQTAPPPAPAPDPCRLQTRAGEVIVDESVAGQTLSFINNAVDAAVPVDVNEDFRTTTMQANLRAQLGADAALPGTSCHEAGFCLDITYNGLASNTQRRALDQAASDAGFTKPVRREAWHYFAGTLGPFGSNTAAIQHNQAVAAGTRFVQRDAYPACAAPQPQ